MKVFNTYMKILWKNRVGILINIVIYIFVSIITSNNGYGNVDSSFAEAKIDMAVIDRDRSETSCALKDYLAATQSLVELEDSTFAMQEALYYSKVDYILIIPEGFEANLANGTDFVLTNIKLPNARGGIYLDIQLEELLSTIRVYVSTGLTPHAALTKTLNTLSKSIDVSIAKSKNLTATVPAFSSFYKLLPYAFITALISGISTVLVDFNKKDIHQRMVSSAFPLRKRNSQLILGCIAFAGIIFALTFAVSIIYFKGEPLKSPMFGFYILNGLCMIVVSIALSYLVGIICKSAEHATMFSVTLSLLLSFLGGVFVPIAAMDAKIKVVAKFLPTYWFSTAHDIISGSTHLEGTALSDTLLAFLIQILFALAILAVSLIISKRKMQEA